jgi:predicted DNA-binding transcriptional regulator YafY
MPVNRNAYSRYLAYDKCFQKKNRSYTIRELMKEINPPVSRAMLYNDLAYMKSEEGFKAPIISRMAGGVARYTYLDPDFSIVKQPIRDSERESLLETMILLSRSSGLPGFEWVGETLLRIEQTLNAPVKSRPFIIFQHNPFLEGLNKLDELFRGIAQKRVLKIRYKPFFEKEMSVIFHPYVLKQYNQRWYCFGLNGPLQKIYNLAVDRIIGIKELKLAFIENTSLDFEAYFNDVVGVTVHKEAKSEEIILEVNRELLPYVLTKPIHPSQIRIRKQKKLGWGTVSLQVIPNFELESILLSFTPNIRVVKPLWLRDKILGKLKEGVNVY